MDIEQIIQAVGAAVVAIGLVYGGFRAGVKKVGEAIEGPDPFEELDTKLSAKVDPIMKAINDGIDKLNPKTHGGAGNGPGDAD